MYIFVYWTVINSIWLYFRKDNENRTFTYYVYVYIYIVLVFCTECMQTCKHTHRIDQVAAVLFIWDDRFCGGSGGLLQHWRGRARGISIAMIRAGYQWLPMVLEHHPSICGETHQAITGVTICGKPIDFSFLYGKIPIKAKVVNAWPMIVDRSQSCSPIWCRGIHSTITGCSPFAPIILKRGSTLGFLLIVLVFLFVMSWTCQTIFRLPKVWMKSHRWAELGIYP